MRSKFGLPYLVERYSYECFKRAEEELNRMYNALPDELKGFFTLDENGIHIDMLPYEETQRRFNSLLSKLNAM